MKHRVEVKDYKYPATLILIAFIFEQSGRKSLKADEYLVSNMGEQFRTTTAANSSTLIEQPTFTKAYFSATKGTFQNGKMMTKTEMEKTTLTNHVNTTRFIEL